MKRILVILCLFVLAMSFAFSQAPPVRTENASDRYVFYTAANAGDTVFTAATTVAAGSAITRYNVKGVLRGILVGTPIASDTILVKNGTGTVVQIVMPASGAAPTFFPVNTRLDTSLIFIQKKGSSTTVFFRTGY